MKPDTSSWQNLMYVFHEVFRKVATGVFVSTDDVILQNINMITELHFSIQKTHCDLLFQ